MKEFLKDYLYDSSVWKAAQFFTFLDSNAGNI